MTSQATGDLATTVAENIRAARLAGGMTQRGLAEALNVEQMVVSKWERKQHYPSAENMVRLASTLGRSVAWFYTDHERTAA